MKLKHVNWFSPHPLSKNYWIGSAAAFIVVLTLVGTAMLFQNNPSESSPPLESGVQTTIEGEVVCLPHIDTSGPQTLECAYGVKLEDGTYYALRDTDETYRNISALPTGKQAKLTGTLKQEPSDRYQSTGTFTVTKAEVIN